MLLGLISIVLRKLDKKRGAAAGCADKIDHPAHLDYQRLANTQTKPRALLRTRIAAVNLGKLLKNAVMKTGRNAAAVIDHINAQAPAAAHAGHAHFTASR